MSEHDTSPRLDASRPQKRDLVSVNTETPIHCRSRNQGEVQVQMETSLLQSYAARADDAPGNRSTGGNSTMSTFTL